MKILQTTYSARCPNCGTENFEEWKLGGGYFTCPDCGYKFKTAKGIKISERILETLNPTTTNNVSD